MGTNVSMAIDGVSHENRHYGNSGACHLYDAGRGRGDEVFKDSLRYCSDSNRSVSCVPVGLMRYEAETYRHEQGESHFVVFFQYTGQRVAMLDCPTREVAEREAYRMNAAYRRIEKPPVSTGPRRSVRYFEPDIYA